MQRARDDAGKLLEHLEDSQTILKLYSMCTVNRMTHLFGSDVINEPISSMPPYFYLWESAMTEEFSSMTDFMLCSLTNQDHLPPHAHIIANMSINEGALDYSILAPMQSQHL